MKLTGIDRSVHVTGFRIDEATVGARTQQQPAGEIW
jgi:hypothetical protein